MMKTFTSKIYPLMFIFAFFGLLLLPLRNLTFSPAELETGFYGRDKLISAFADFRLRLGDRVFPKAVAGKDGWLFFTAENSADDYQNVTPFTRVELSEIWTNLEAVNAQLQSRGITLLVVIAPNKSSIYPDYMPAEIPVLRQSSRLDQFMAFFRTKRKTQVLDLRPALLKMRKNRQVYYATDTHWNDYGAFMAYSKILTTLGQTYPALIPLPLENFKYESLGMQNLDLSINIGSATLQEEKFELTPALGSSTNYKSLALDNGRRITLSWNPNQKLPQTTLRGSFCRIFTKY